MEAALYPDVDGGACFFGVDASLSKARLRRPRRPPPLLAFSGSGEVGCESGDGRDEEMAGVFVALAMGPEWRGCEVFGLSAATVVVEVTLLAAGAGLAIGAGEAVWGTAVMVDVARSGWSSSARPE